MKIAHCLCQYYDVELTLSQLRRCRSCLRLGRLAGGLSGRLCSPKAARSRGRALGDERVTYQNSHNLTRLDAFLSLLAPPHLDLLPLHFIIFFFSQSQHFHTSRPSIPFQLSPKT